MFISEIDKAKLWYNERNINCEIVDGDLYVSVQEWDIKVHQDEIEYRARLWDELKKINQHT